MPSKILLISPAYFRFHESASGLHLRDTAPPLGLLYIAATLQNRGYSVNVLDMYGELIQTQTQLVDKLRRCKPDLIGISTLSPNFKEIVDIAQVCKDELPTIPIALGGYFATFNHDLILTKYDCFDFIVRREGEETTDTLVQELERIRPNFTKIKGLTYRANGHVKINPDRPLISNLDALPFPAYEHVSHLSYGGFGGLRMSTNMGSVLTSRGCYYTCKYCACSQLSNHTVRWRTPENVVEELSYLHNTFGIREFMFVDDLFTFDKKRVLDICQLIQHEDLDIKWYSEGRVNHADSLMFQTMEKSGAKGVFFGIESCVDHVLQYYQKGITYYMTQQAVAKAQQAQLDVVGSFILGAPIETLADMRLTVRKALALDLDYAQFNILRIFRGIHLWTQLVTQGLINEEAQWETTVSGFDINPHVTLKDKPRLMKEFHTTFYLRGAYILKQLQRFLKRRKKQLILNLRQPKATISDIRRIFYFQ